MHAEEGEKEQSNVSTQVFVILKLYPSNKPPQIPRHNKVFQHGKTVQKNPWKKEIEAKLTSSWARDGMSFQR